MTTTTKLNAIVPYFGAKRNMAAMIIAEIGDHRAYWEPFCGSLSVLLSMPPCIMETVNDLYGDLTNLARVLQDEQLAMSLYHRVSKTLMAEGVHEDSVAVIRAAAYDGPPDEDRAYHFMVTAWLGRNGVTGTPLCSGGYCVRFTSSGGSAAKRWRSVAESIPDWHYRLRNVTILSWNAFDLIPRIEDKAGTVIYVDPPYIEKGAKYIHDFTEGGHRDLAALLARFDKTRVIVSYYEHPLVDTMYAGWTKLVIEVTKAMANTSQQRGKVTAREVLLINGPSYTEAPRLF